MPTSSAPTHSTGGVTAHIFRWNLGECSNGGISSRVEEVTVIGVCDLTPTGKFGPITPVAGPFKPSEQAPSVILVRRRISGITRDQARVIIHAQPYGDDVPDDGWMAGGTFIHGDSRVSDASGIYGAIALHDRREW